MPKIDFNFSGYIRDAIVTEATCTITGIKINVREMPASELVDKLENGDLCISLGDHLYENRKSEVEMVDYEVSPVWPDEA